MRRALAPDRRRPRSLAGWLIPQFQAFRSGGIETRPHGAPDRRQRGFTHQRSRERAEVWEDPRIAAMRETRAGTVTEDQLEELLADAGTFFEAHLWESESCRAAR